MAKLFNITLPTDSTNLKLRGKQRVNVTYTVSNLTGRHVRGRVVLKPDDPAVKNKWITLSGETEKDFDANSTFQFPVTVNIPPNAPPGKYTFRLDAVNADIPDEGDSGSPCGFEIAAEEKKKMPVWIFPVAEESCATSEAGCCCTAHADPDPDGDDAGRSGQERLRRQHRTDEAAYCLHRSGKALLGPAGE